MSDFKCLVPTTPYLMNSPSSKTAHCFETRFSLDRLSGLYMNGTIPNHTYRAAISNTMAGVVYGAWYY